MNTWHLVAPEFPPACGGVGDYTALLSAALAREGDRVHVWHPGMLPDRFGAAARTAIESGLASDPGSLLVQYVPSAFGLRGLNLPFCLWLHRLRRRGVDVRVMFHEPFFYFGVDRPWRNGLALGQRAMAAVLLRAAGRVYYSTETWRRLLAPYGPQAHVEVLPIPATIPTDVASRMGADGRTTDAMVVGHFGTYGEHVATELRPVLRAVADRLSSVRLLLAGRGAAAFAAALDDDLRSRIDVFDAAGGDEIASALRGCDILVQPYPDGVTTRRTSVMAALTTGRPVVTTRGDLTEAVWTETAAVALVPPGAPEALASEVAALASDAQRRLALGARGRQLYDERFALPLTVARIRRA